jgi:hypothetical protein
MTDVPYAATQTAALALLVRALAGGGRLALAAGWLVALAALSIRQIGVAIPIGLGIATIWRDGWRWRALAMATGPVLAFIAVQRGFESWLAATQRVPVQFGQNSGEIASRLAAPWSVIATEVGNGFIYLYLYGGLFMMPLAILAYRDMTTGLRIQAATVVHSAVFGAAGLHRLGGSFDRRTHARLEGRHRVAFGPRGRSLRHAGGARLAEVGCDRPGVVGRRHDRRRRRAAGMACPARRPAVCRDADDRCCLLGRGRALRAAAGHADPLRPLPAAHHPLHHRPRPGLWR